MKTTATTLHRSRHSARDVRRVEYAANVAEALGTLEHGCEIYGLSRGQYSLIDLVEYILAQTGPADVVISTWTAAGADIGYALRMRRNGNIRSLRWLVDASFPVRQPGYCAAMRERFGDESIRVTKNHAKFVRIANDEWHIVCRTSMNLNENKRIESFEISDDPELCAYLGEFIDGLFTAIGGTEQFVAGNTAAERAFRSTSDANIPPQRRVIRYLK